LNATVKQESLPYGAVQGAGVLVGLALLLVLGARLLHLHPAASAQLVQPVRVMHLTFVDRKDGAVVIGDADHDNATIHVVPPQTNGFLRGVLRGLARARRNEHVGEEPPFTLTRWADGQMTLADPTTGQRISLEVFGPTNAHAFAQLLTDDPVTDDKEPRT
jgi:putative photosynthetic complex assembly protein